MVEASFSSKITETLRDEILDRRLPAATLVLEKEVAARFGVSKTPAREALAALCQEGLVQLIPRRGYMVKSLTVQQVLDTFDLRVILEGAAAERAASNLREDELARLEELTAHDCCAPGGGHPQASPDAITQSLEFHLIIAQGSRNELLAAEIEKLLRSSRLIRTYGFTHGEHQEIVQKLRSGDGAASRKAMEAHILSGRELALRNLSTTGG